MPKNSLPWLRYDPAKVEPDIAMLEGAAVKAYFVLMHHLWREGASDEGVIRKFTSEEFHGAIMARMTAVEGGFSYAWLEEARSNAKRLSSAQSERANKGWAARKSENAPACSGHAVGIPGHAAGMQSASNGHAHAMQIEIESKSKEEREAPSDPPPAPQPPRRRSTRRVIDLTVPLGERKEAFRLLCKEVVDKDPDRLSESERAHFYGHWTEPNSAGLMRWEDEKFFDVGKRMDTWMKRSEEFSKK